MRKRRPAAKRRPPEEGPLHSQPSHRTRVPHFSRPLREVGFRRPILLRIWKSSKDATFPIFASLCIWHSEPTTASLEPRFSTPSLRPTIFVPIFRHPRKPNHPSRLPPTNYSFKVVFRDFRIIHSVPAKSLICSDWNIRPVLGPSSISGIAIRPDLR